MNIVYGSNLRTVETGPQTQLPFAGFTVWGNVLRLSYAFRNTLEKIFS